MQESEYFRLQARECRDAARRAKSNPDSRALMQLARYYDSQATKLETGSSKVMH